MAELPESLIPQVAPEQQPQRVKKGLVWALFGGLLLLAGIVLWYYQPKAKIDPARMERAPSEDVGTGNIGLTTDQSKRQDSYALPVSKQAPPPRPGQPQQAQIQPNPLLGNSAIPPRPGPPPPLPPPPEVVLVNNGQAQRPPQQGQQPKPPLRWFSTVSVPRGDKLEAPFPPDPKDTQESKLFPKARWEKPKDPYKILYMDQVVQVLLANNINSDFPGMVRLRVTEAVMDRWGHGHELVPLDTVFVGTQQGQAQFNQTRIPINVTHAIFPDGTAIQWTRTQVGDELGANALPAQVDNHYFKLILGVGLQALLNIGTRVPFGSPGQDQFQQNLPQEFAQNATQGINQAGNRIIQQQFSVRPTLSQEHGYPATINFSENVSFMTPPTVANK